MDGTYGTEYLVFAPGYSVRLGRKKKKKKCSLDGFLLDVVTGDRYGVTQYSTIWTHARAPPAFLGAETDTGGTFVMPPGRTAARYGRQRQPFIIIIVIRLRLPTGEFFTGRTFARVFYNINNDILTCPRARAHIIIILLFLQYRRYLLGRRL